MKKLIMNAKTFQSFIKAAKLLRAQKAYIYEGYSIAVSGNTYVACKIEDFELFERDMNYCVINKIDNPYAWNCKKENKLFEVRFESCDNMSNFWAIFNGIHKVGVYSVEEVAGSKKFQMNKYSFYGLIPFNVNSKVEKGLKRLAKICGNKLMKVSWNSSFLIFEDSNSNKFCVGQN